jgi:Cu(I)/Ag(I) efflux system protein CusF
VIALLLMVTLPAYAWAVLGLPDDQHPCKAGQKCKTGGLYRPEVTGAAQPLAAGATIISAAESLILSRDPGGGAMNKRNTSLIVTLLMAASLTAHSQGMQDMPMKDMPTGANSQDRRHHASGTVKKLDASVGTVTFAHGPVKSLNWPAMTMNFRVEDKALLDKLAVGKQAEFEFVQEGSDYLVIAVR